MSTLLFKRRSQTITCTSHGVDYTFPAANNVDSRSKGIWPAGVYPFSWYRAPRAGDPQDTLTGAYGARGLLIFDVPGRTGMAAHAGRAGVPDGRGRAGYLHCTFGCVRSTDDAMVQFLLIHATDPITQMEVVDA